LNESEQKRMQRSESFLVGALLAVSGGFLDAYTYLCRGGVFANAQTGNMVLLALRASERRWREAGMYLIPILAFFAGVLVAESIKTHRKTAGGRFHWRHLVLGVEIATLTAASFIPRGGWNGAVNILVSFVCALQVETFRTVQGNPFASTMCTGNLRSGTDALYHGLFRHDRIQLRRSALYFGIIACFICGAALGGVLSEWAPQRAVLLAAGLQLVAFFLMYEARNPALD